MQATCYSLSPLHHLWCSWNRPAVIPCHHLWCFWSRPAVILCHHLWCSWSRSAVILSPLVVFLEQTSCYSVTTHGVSGAAQPFSVTIHGVPGAGQLLSLSPLIVFMIARAAIFSPRNFISCPGNYLILSKDWGSGVPASNERIQGAAK